MSNTKNDSAEPKVTKSNPLRLSKETLKGLTVKSGCKTGLFDDGDRGGGPISKCGKAC